MPLGTCAITAAGLGVIVGMVLALAALAEILKRSQEYKESIFAHGDEMELACLKELNMGLGEQHYCDCPEYLQNQLAGIPGAGGDAGLGAGC